MMQIRVRDDSVEISGYVNAIERNSKPLMSRIGRFIERVCKGAFSKALKRNEDVKLLLNHNPQRELASTKEGTLSLSEDNIGLHARATITDDEVVKKAKHGDLVGWSFGFYDTPNGVEQGIDDESKLPLRKLRDLDLREVSILDNSKTPAYDGTLVSVRADDDVTYYGEPMISEMEIREETQPKQHENVEEKEIDYSKYEQMIRDMREE
jgi:HK97 family phage prohead protease